jgi:nitrite reductase (NADH) small subunit
MMRPSDVLTPTLGLQQNDMPSANGHEADANESTPTVADHGWVRICGVDDIPRLGARVVRREVAPGVAIFRTADDKFFALADRCPHRGGPLSQGIVFGERVACPLHNTCIELDSGCAVAPDKGEVQTFPVNIVEGDIYVDFHGR